MQWRTANQKEFSVVWWMLCAALSVMFYEYVLVAVPFNMT